MTNIPKPYLRLVVDNSGRPGSRSPAKNCAWPPLANVLRRHAPNREPQHAVWFPDTLDTKTLLKLRNALPRAIAQELFAEHLKDGEEEHRNVFCLLIFGGGPSAPKAMHEALLKLGFNSVIQDVEVSPEDATLCLA